MRTPLALATLTWMAAAPALGQPTQHPTAPSPAAKAPALHRPSVAIESYTSTRDERITLYLGASSDPRVRTVPGGIELLVDDPWTFRLAHYHALGRVTGIEFREEDGKSVALIRLACNCGAKIGHGAGEFTLDIQENVATPEQATVSGHTPQSPTAAAGHPNADLDRLRDTLTAKLAELNAPRGASRSPAASAHNARQSGAPSQPPLVPAAAVAQTGGTACPPPLNVADWKGQGRFTTQLEVLRGRAATAHEAPQSMVALARLYLVYGLAREALNVLQEAQPAADADAETTKLSELADIAHLLIHEPIGAGSPLLAAPPGCARPDLPLWQALAAAVSRDTQAVAQAAQAAQEVLRTIPEPLLQLTAFEIADATPGNPMVLRAMASAVRNTTVDSPESEAARFLIQARIAGAERDTADQMAFLERAASRDGTVPGATAKVELAGLRATQDGPIGAAAEVTLADAARVYRADELGQTAAAYLTERRLRLGDYATALAVADASAGPAATRHTDSRGAAMAAQILRKLLVDPVANGLPAPAERLTLYWRYEGYATPGPQGDDIRIGAARIMLAEDMPTAALELLKTVAVSPEALLLRATAEARGGDPAAALVLLKALPADDTARRVTADALARLGQPANAAHALDGLTSVADRVRQTELLMAAADWPELAQACDDLLRDPSLVDAARNDVADRYSLALALSGLSPDHRVTTAPGSLATTVLAALPRATESTTADGMPSLSAVRSALTRAKQTETLLPSTDIKQGS